MLVALLKAEMSDATDSGVGDSLPGSSDTPDYSEERPELMIVHIVCSVIIITRIIPEDESSAIAMEECKEDGTEGFRVYRLIGI